MEAISSNDTIKWCDAMKSEINALKMNDTYEVTTLLTDKTLVGSQ